MATTWGNISKNTATWGNISKNPSGLTFAELPMSILKNIGFQDAVLSDGTKLEDVTFDTIVPSTLINAYIATLWVNYQKN